MRLFYREYGAGKPLVVLHGLFGSADNWHTVAQEIGRARRVIAADLRNHGRSPHNREFTYREMANDVAALIGELGLARAAVMGHSMGGKTAMELALSRPALVERLIVVDIAPKRYPPHYEDLRDALLSIDLERLRSRTEAERLIAPRVPDRNLRLFLLKNLGRDEEGHFFWRLDLETIAASFDNIWAEIDGGRSFPGPTLFLRGARSDYVSEGDFPSIQRLFPQARFESIEGAGHWVHADKPEALVSAVGSFLSQDLTSDAEIRHPLS